MINLSVEIDSTLLTWLEKNYMSLDKWDDYFENYCEQNGINLPKASFVDFPDEISKDDLERLRRQVDLLNTRKEDSIAHINRFFPKVEEDIAHNLKVVLLPFGKINYGPTIGYQLYSIFPDSNLVETYLFLIHIYYHEISFINYTQRSLYVSENNHKKEDYLDYLKLLIQNEGIGNYAVIKDLETLKKQITSNYKYNYFKYANKINDKNLLVKCLETLNQISSMSNDNFEKYCKKINHIIKSEELPAINIIGLHMANSIAKAFGESTLIQVYKVEPDNFFNLYKESGDPYVDFIKDVYQPIKI
ncbi:hypothetical protein M3589_17720 [Heyndrickxia oleronia]|uniref:DUF5700 domain-containing putative Zn-dependent protease n=1 Tax=Heyndrickxia oleronia TaxID=38875 RepID=UPI002040799F|nr:DUF5700 domain-containing putative Zn-dependent protease [Heyndrickxia oleronia]MCM3239541.1 hypothetical protein [Heyndrickxia oleronia]